MAENNKRKEYLKAYYQRNKDKSKAKYQENKAEITAKLREKYKAGGEELKKKKSAQWQEWFTKNKSKVYDRMKDSRPSDEHYKARRKLRHQVKLGNVKRPCCCDRCKIKTIPDAHHSDYSKPLDVIWLCNDCHTNEHKCSEEVR